MVGGQVDLAGAGQGRAAGGNGDGGGAVLAGDVGSIHQVAGAARVGDDHGAVTGAEQGRAHHLHVAVAGGNGRDAQTEELVLRVLCHDARVAHAVELDAFAGFPGGCNRLGRTLQRHGAGGIAVLQKGRHGVVHHLHQHVAGLVVGVHAAVDEGHAFAHAACQLELEICQSVIPHAAAKAHHSGLAHVRAFGQFTHGQACKSAWVGQHQPGNALFGGGQGGQGGGDAVEHVSVRVCSAGCSGEAFEQVWGNHS
ncbi:hypothetical protein D3C71_1180640 [compost metagenome]